MTERASLPHTTGANWRKTGAPSQLRQCASCASPLKDWPTGAAQIGTVRPAQADWRSPAFLTAVADRLRAAIRHADLATIEAIADLLHRPTRPFRRDDLLRELHTSLYPDLSARAAAEVICREASRYETTAFKHGAAEPSDEPSRTIHEILISTGKTFPAKRTVRRALGQGS
jgi:hypothetical protein